MNRAMYAVVALIALFSPAVFCACSQGIGCPLNREAGSKWIENCQTCSCTGNITYHPPMVCYLPSETMSCQTNLHTIKYNGGPTTCPPGFMSATSLADLALVKASLVLLFQGRGGGEFGCCTLATAMKPTFPFDACDSELNMETCRHRAFLIGFPERECPVQPNGITGR